MSQQDNWELVARYTTGESAPAERSAVEARARTDAAFAAKLTAARRTHAGGAGEVDAHAAWRKVHAGMHAGATAPADAGTAGYTRRVPAASRRFGTAARAGFIAAAAAVAVWIGMPTGGPEPPALPEAVVWITEPAAGRTLQLDDGSVVRLGPDSRLESDRAPRTLHLEGVAFFAVEHDATRPFTVRSRAGTIRVLGTRFEARTRGDTVDVLVVEGRVALTAEDGSHVELEAGQAGRLVRGVAPELKAAPAERPGAWLGRVLLFRDTRLADAVAEIGAVYGVPVTILRPELDTLRVSAQFDERPLDEVLETLCRVIDARCAVTPEAATIR